MNENLQEFRLGKEKKKRTHVSGKHRSSLALDCRRRAGRGAEGVGACSGAPWSTVFKVKMPVRKGHKIIFFAFTGTTCYNLTTQGTLGCTVVGSQ